MNEYAAFNRAEGGGVEFEGAIEVFPSGSEGRNGGLTEKVEGELGLREEFIP